MTRKQVNEAVTVASRYAATYALAKAAYVAINDVIHGSPASSGNDYAALLAAREALDRLCEAHTNRKAQEYLNRLSGNQDPA